MDWIVESFQQYPELAIFLTLALGNWMGNLKLGKLSLGPVSGTLLAGVLVGQMQIAISPNVKSIFFIMFLFAVGYSVGPQFFRGLKSDGTPQVLFAFLQCLTSLLSVYTIARFLGYDAGTAAGLLSGSQTTSTILGVAADTIGQMDIAGAQKAALINQIPVAYAVTYLFGTAGSAWLLSSLGPKLLRVDLAAECKTLEAALGGTESEPGVVSAGRRIDVRTFRVTNDRWANKSVAEIEDHLKAARTSIERIRRNGDIVDAEPTMVIHRGDVIAIVGRREVLVETDLDIGPEVHDFELMDFPSEAVDVVITNRAVTGKTLGEISDSEIGRVHARGVYLTHLIRGGEEMPFMRGTTIDRGDVLRIVGARRNIERAVNQLGYADRPTNASDMVFVASGIALGGLIGAVTLQVGGVPVSLGTGGGTLVAGLVFGWLRAVNRTFGRIPAPALWILSNLGLTTFIAVVGITTGPSFVAGLREAGLSLLVAGIVATSVPLIAGVLMGKYLFKFHPGIVLGAVAGAQTTTAALPMIQDVAKSKVPALGYTVPYAVGLITLTLWGVVIVLLMQ